MIEPAERALLEATVTDALAAAAPDEADAVLTEIGWLEMLAAEPDDALAIVFTALGTTNTAATAIDDVLISALGLEPGPDRAVLLPPFGTWNPPVPDEFSDGWITGLVTTRAERAGEALVLLPGGEDNTDHHLVSSVTASAFEVLGRGGVDPTAGFRAARVRVPDAGATPLDPAAARAFVAAGRRAVAYQLAGSNRTMLDLARTHALEREQFGRRIASFQAVRHRLAEALVAVEALDAALGAAADDPGPLTAALAKATAARSARIVATQCQQVLAGIGFTTDHPFHRYLKRTMALEGLFGTAEAITCALGHHLLSSRRVPTLIDL